MQSMNINIEEKTDNFPKNSYSKKIHWKAKQWSCNDYLETLFSLESSKEHEGNTHTRKLMHLIRSWICMQFKDGLD